MSDAELKEERYPLWVGAWTTLIVSGLFWWGIISLVMKLTGN